MSLDKLQKQYTFHLQKRTSMLCNSLTFGIEKLTSVAQMQPMGHLSVFFLKQKLAIHYWTDSKPPTSQMLRNCWDFVVLFIRTSKTRCPWINHKSNTHSIYRNIAPCYVTLQPLELETWGLRHHTFITQHSHMFKEMKHTSHLQVIQGRSLCCCHNRCENLTSVAQKQPMGHLYVFFLKQKLAIHYWSDSKPPTSQMLRNCWDFEVLFIRTNFISKFDVLG